MAVISLLFLAVMYVVHHPLMVSDRMDLDTLARSRQLEKRMSEEMRQLEMEFEERRRDAEQKQKAEKFWRGDHDEEELVLGKKDMGWLFQANRPGPLGWMLGNLWNAGLFCLFLIFELVRQNMQHEPAYDSSSDEEEEEVRLVPVTSSNWLAGFPSRDTLESFYKHRVQNAIRDLPCTCEFVESFVDDLIEACRVVGRREAHPQLEDCLGIGAAFEKWGTVHETQAFDILVPIAPPQGTVFVLEMRDPALGHRCGSVLVESECACKHEKLLGDVLCLVHHHHREHPAHSGMCSSATKAALCTASYLDVYKTVQWFQKLLSNAWALVAHKYDFKLSLPLSTTACNLRLDYRSGRSLSIRLILGVQREDTLVYLVSQAADQEQLTSVDWPESFAACEHLFLKLVGRFAPENTCHLKCLQIILSLRDTKDLPPGSSPPILTSYHFKTALMHLLLRLPLTDWQPDMISQRLQDILWFLGRGLQQRSLHHFLIGNNFLPLTIPIPKTFRNAEPVNLFQHLVLNPMAHSQAVEEFHSLLTQVKTLPCAHLAEGI
ncbi:inositol 1,4,5-trisphosphate receptor-interacting protein-like 1 [Sorex araneus]|uniref:inositol 1,4,5-trisphosphate receptor-interacting protein-like 1 n=1 Tax=Sorex araneus TaxID=42254 RepID=UPI002433AC07|nr:inositol 1,4,5-trisphosphate receptor-interacting protein-like 1 [Sorex araneus]XP_054977737.1 inositol 1,4,5-trisphosphate receptor-interacting protein-like 1 [Sorex araneus]